MQFYPINSTALGIFNEMITEYKNSELWYRAASQWADRNGFKCLSDWLVERQHLMHHYAHRIERRITDNGGLPDASKLSNIDSSDFESILNILALAVKFEYEMCDSWQSNYTKLLSETPKDANFIMKYIKKQEKSVKCLQAKQNTFDGAPNDKLSLLELSKIAFK